MKRPIAALLLTICLFAGVYAYTSFVRSIARDPLKIQENFSTDEYSVRITRTCDLVGDTSFGETYALHVQFRGKDLFLEKDSLSKSKKIEKQFDGVTENENEIYISANVKSTDESDEPGDEESAEQTAQLGGIRVQVLQGEFTVADQTIWQEPGDPSINGSVSFSGTSTEQHEH